MPIVWTLDEAEAAWRQGRTDVNLAHWFRVVAKESMSCGASVDGNLVTVVVYLNEEVKQRILSTRAGYKDKATKAKKATRRSWEKEWKKNGCVKLWSGKWIVPYELIWRSLPHGEDR